ncbi:MAG: hemin uptake protein HemP [Polaromonas sp.]|uniref:hemin uptake protein HemP n=1 Tax=Polaromonas sp. TaxID=1869339 RepID=UPI00403647A0|nr:hemin uptake protein HemP [Polaromonas sp.]
MSLALHPTTLSLPSRDVRRDAGALPAAAPRNADGGALESTEILRGQKAVEIKHNGLTYRLQATRLGKLILTK